ncbi:MAG: hypothetical protein AB7E12_12635 [Burkholderiaceae bacterium]
MDKLVSVRLLDGRESLLLIHVEIQGGYEAEFPYRMYTYYVRLSEKHPGEHLVSLAVLTDSSRRYGAGRQRTKPGPGHTGARHKEARDLDGPGGLSSLSHQVQFWNCHLRFTFPVVHLESWRTRLGELIELAPANPFAVVVLAQLEANATRPDAHRLVRKTELVRQLYRWGYQRDNVIQLFRILDAMLTLPEALEPAFEEAVQQIEEETQVSYVTSIERVRLRREREEGIAEGKTEGFATLLSSQITRKFGTLPDWAKVRLVSADDPTLNRWAEQILDAQSLEDVFR